MNYLNRDMINEGALDAMDDDAAAFYSAPVGHPDMEFESASDLIVVGRNEDGEMVGECYFVSAVHKDGRRWRLPVGADSRGEYVDEYGEANCWVEVNDEAKDKCDEIAFCLSGGMSGRDAALWAGSRWSVDRPVYGSASHDEFALYDDDDWAIYNRGY